MFFQEQQFNNTNQMNMEQAKYFNRQSVAPTQSILKDLSIPFQQSKQLKNNNQYLQENMSSGSTHCDSDCDSQSSTPVKQKQQQQQQKQNKLPQQQQQQGKKVLSPTELQNLQQQNYKTEICRNWRQNGGVCQYGKKCRYAHGEDELTKKANVSEYFKTRECKLFHQEGYCSYGIRCHFIHVNKTQDDLQKESKLTRESCLEKGIVLQNEKSRFGFAREQNQQQEIDFGALFLSNQQAVKKEEPVSVLQQLQLPKLQKKQQAQKKMKEVPKQQQTYNFNQLQYLQYLNQTNNVNYQQFQLNQQQTCFA
ncbi:hypothetical protein PPERSA_11647 [Pseudocohnilembus persalinus]|uniref:C3H1-type domain-containing protein n=1 Tax=Pseudocohnilembus persalinus TaxID=266149 RepID=A0A0V0Q9Y3_PSEPJ|nr:hypothetical protein PPERSA_11647 [Pseudocohnilembus persalinus]|eukprot:KRW99046.1 hypothetical protein PPERSA_11647 [Pseudocohnilembus persalinus]